jgi:tRNA(His) 5'-end guanylyltransferase
MNYNNEPEMFKKGSVVFRDVSPSTWVVTRHQSLTLSSMSLLSLEVTMWLKRLMI